MGTNTRSILTPLCDASKCLPSHDPMVRLSASAALFAQVIFSRLLRSGSGGPSSKIISSAMGRAANLGQQDGQETDPPIGAYPPRVPGHDKRIETASRQPRDSWHILSSYRRQQGERRQPAPSTQDLRPSAWAKHLSPHSLEFPLLCWSICTLPQSGRGCRAHIQPPLDAKAPQVPRARWSSAPGQPGTK
jgi:hypothetical protein